MSAVLNDSVLVVNRNWCAIDVTTVDVALCNIFRGVATGIDTGSGPDELRPVTIQEWLKLPIRPASGTRPADKAILSVHGPVRVPTVIAAVNYSKVPKKRPKLCSHSIRERDGNRCQYTGKLLRPSDGSLDHVVPRSRGGKDTWENLVWSAKTVNQKKADRLPQEAGLRLLSTPRSPLEIPATALIRRRADKPDWDYFLVR